MRTAYGGIKRFEKIKIGWKRLMLKRITIVLAQWCPHCVPLSLEKVQEIAKNLDIELRVLDIDDSEQEEIADMLVKAHGDFAEDYLIPQVFIEHDDGLVNHIFTGFSEGVHITSARWDDFKESKFYRQDLQRTLST